MSGTLYIYTNKILENIASTRKKIGSAKLCAVVKANCYGMGTDLCRILQNSVDYFAVASVAEAITLANDISKPILVLAPPTLEEIKLLDKINFTNIEFAVESLSVLKGLAGSQNEYKIHIAANTGMNRYGCNFKTFEKMLKVIADNPNIKLIGLFSHFYKNTPSIMKLQFNRFKRFIKRASLEYDNIICHISNSHGLDYSLDMVRLGIEMYSPSNASCLKLTSKIKSVKKIKKGDIVSYNGNFKAERTTKIAIVPLGYADGIMRKLGGLNVLVKGKVCPIIGDICMDCFMIDISSVQNVKPGEEIIIFGDSGKKSISVCNLAEKCDTISYEILTRLGDRINRVYK